MMSLLLTLELTAATSFATLHAIIPQFSIAYRCTTAGGAQRRARASIGFVSSSCLAIRVSSGSARNLRCG